jgi:hypothetical protein
MQQPNREMENSWPLMVTLQPQMPDLERAKAALQRVRRKEADWVWLLMW